MSWIYVGACSRLAWNGFTNAKKTQHKDVCHLISLSSDKSAVVRIIASGAHQDSLVILLLKERRIDLCFLSQYFFQGGFSMKSLHINLQSKLANLNDLMPC